LKLILQNVKSPQKLTSFAILPLLLLLGAFISIFGNGIYIMAGMVVLFVVIYNTMYSTVPPVFGFLMFYHWLQTFAAIVLCNINNQDIDAVEPFTSKAVMLSFIGVAIMSTIMSIAVKKNILTQSSNELQKIAEKLSFFKILNLYLFGLIFKIVISQFTRGALGQFVWSFMEVKWLFYLLMVFKVSLEKKNRNILIIITLIEFITGFLSFFSSFKEVIFFLIIGTFISFEKIKVKQVVGASVVGMILFFVMVTWTSIKGEYRAFANKGSSSQTFQVENDEAVDKLAELYENQSDNSFTAGIASLVYRIQYMENFAKVLKQVPARVPHEEGNLWKSNLEFVFTPRFLNENKGTFDASAKSNKYTGTIFATAAMGTSISMGYFSEGYIDFGAEGMFLPLIIIALVMMYFYNYMFTIKNSNALLNYAFVVTTFIPFYLMESDAIFYTGRLFFSISSFLFIKYYFSDRILKYISV
jgi:hypothetical protein